MGPVNHRFLKRNLCKEKKNNQKKRVTKTLAVKKKEKKIPDFNATPRELALGMALVSKWWSCSKMEDFPENTHWQPLTKIPFQLNCLCLSPSPRLRDEEGAVPKTDKSFAGNRF